jgi:hypothetical protein
MGYCVELTEKNFKIKKEDCEEILKALKEFIKDKEDLMWINERYFLECDNIERCFDLLRYPLYENGDCYEIDYMSGEKLGDEEKIFNSIAKFIEKDSYLQYIGEDGDIFRLVFDGEKCEYKYPKMIWD